MIVNNMQAIPSEMILSENMLGFDTAALIPIDLGESIHFTPTTKIEQKILPIGSNKLITTRPQSGVPIVELGKWLLEYSRDGMADAVRDLMGKGAPFSTDWLGTSALHFAAMGNHLRTCEILLRAGICKDARTKVERTPLHMAAYEGHIQIVELLLKHGADVNCKDMLKMTPLHWAVQNEHDECIKVLLQYGAEINVINKFDKTPVSMAYEQDRLDIVEILQKALNAMNEKAQTMEIQRATLAATQSISEQIDDLPKSSNSLKAEKNDEDDDMSQNVDDLISSQTNNHLSSENVTDLNTLKLLEAHGITMLPNDDSSIVASAMESGQTVVLTEAGKLALNLTKPNQEEKEPPSSQTLKMGGRKIITLRTDQFLALTGGKYQNIIKKLSGKPLKRIVMTKNKITVSPKTVQLAQLKINKTARIESLMKQLNEARKVADELKRKYLQKEQEIAELEKQLETVNCITL